MNRCDHPEHVLVSCCTPVFALDLPQHFDFVSTGHCPNAFEFCGGFGRNQTRSGRDGTGKRTIEVWPQRRVREEKGEMARGGGVEGVYFF